MLLCIPTSQVKIPKNCWGSSAISPCSDPCPLLALNWDSAWGLVVFLRPSCQLMCQEAQPGTALSKSLSGRPLAIPGLLHPTTHHSQPDTAQANSMVRKRCHISRCHLTYVRNSNWAGLRVPEMPGLFTRSGEGLPLVLMQPSVAASELFSAQYLKNRMQRNELGLQKWEEGNTCNGKSIGQGDQKVICSCIYLMFLTPSACLSFSLVGLSQTLGDMFILWVPWKTPWGVTVQGCPCNILSITLLWPHSEQHKPT